MCRVPAPPASGPFRARPARLRLRIPSRISSAGLASIPARPPPSASDRRAIPRLPGSPAIHALYRVQRTRPMSAPPRVAAPARGKMPEMREHRPECTLLIGKSQIHRFSVPRSQRRKHRARHRHGCSQGESCRAPAARRPVRSVAHNFHRPGAGPMRRSALRRRGTRRQY